MGRPWWKQKWAKGSCSITASTPKRSLKSLAEKERSQDSVRWPTVARAPQRCSENNRLPRRAGRVADLCRLWSDFSFLLPSWVIRPYAPISAVPFQQVGNQRGAVRGADKEGRGGWLSLQRRVNPEGSGVVGGEMQALCRPGGCVRRHPLQRPFKRSPPCAEHWTFWALQYGSPLSPCGYLN